MDARITALCVGATLAVLAGCGSSSSSTHSGPTQATTQRTQAGAPGVKVDVKPKFAGASGPVRSGTVDVAYRDIAIEPDTVRVTAGSTVVWTNYDSTEHNVTSVGAGPQRIASGNFGERRTFSVKLTKPGVIHYVSTQQPASMNGTIEVVK
jgi:plastocyanin